MSSSKSQARDGKSKKKSTAPKKSATAAQAQVSYKSSEYVQESEEDEQENSDKENESNRDDESLPSNPANSVRTPNGKLPPPAGSSISSENESESEDSASEAEDEEEAAQTAAFKRSSDVKGASKKPAKEPNAKAVTFQPPPPYKAPRGFEEVALPDTTKASHMFKKSSLEGKQVWYFTVPASLSLSSIEEISLKDVKAGKAVIKHRESDYGFIPDSAGDKTYTQIMVPYGSDDGYRTTTKQIDQIFHLQQIVKLPGVHSSSTTTAGSGKASIASKKPVREQPSGLKMRFRPIGFVHGDTGKIGPASPPVNDSSSSDKEMGEAPAPFRRPASVASESSEEEECSANSDVEMAEAPPLKKKSDKDSAIMASSQETLKSSVKRKHTRGEEKKSKHSSSRSSNINDRELKRLKKKQEKSRRRLEDRPSASLKQSERWT